MRLRPHPGGVRGEAENAHPGNAGGAKAAPGSDAWDHAAILDRMHGIVSPDKLTKKQKQIWQYLRFHPDETNLSVIARGAGVNRHTVAKWYEMIRGMVGIQKT